MTDAAKPNIRGIIDKARRYDDSNELDFATSEVILELADALEKVWEASVEDDLERWSREVDPDGPELGEII